MTKEPIIDPDPNAAGSYGGSELRPPFGLTTFFYSKV